MTDDQHEAADDVDQALQAFQAAYEHAATLIARMSQPQQAFEQATALREIGDQLVGKAADLRARMARRIWEAEKMSLASLADRIGVSKARADQFIRTTKRDS